MKKLRSIVLSLFICGLALSQNYDKQVQDDFNTTEIKPEGVKAKLNHIVRAGDYLAFYEVTDAIMATGDTITLVDAPGVNKFIVPIELYSYVVVGDTAYDCSTGDSIYVKSTAAGSAVTLATIDSVAIEAAASQAKSYTFSSVIIDDNAAVTLQIPDIATGDGTFTVCFVYRKEQYPEIY